MSKFEIIVRANPDLDDCLSGAAEAYISAHPSLRGWDLSPHWTDERRELVTLTVPWQSAFNFSADALSAIDETGCDPESDLRALTTGEHTPESLLAHCLDGADEDREQGWRDYVSEVVAAHEATRS